jgi:mannose-6-phosphate isomerase-like protein (cupin superfamily)
MREEEIGKMRRFMARPLPADPDAIAPDGSEVRVLCSLRAASMAHFRLPAGAVSRAVSHRTVEEIWYVVEGTGEMWRSQDGVEEVLHLEPGLSLTIPLGTVFQFRADATRPLAAVGVTIPPWPGDGEAVEDEGPWQPTT